MALLDLNVDFITEQTIQSLADNTNITHLSPGSKARLLLDIINDKLGIQANQFDANTGKAFIRNASGLLLDFIGEIYGVPRQLKTKPRISKEERNFYLYTFQNNFGEINNSEPINIPAGNIAIYNTDNPDEKQIVYTNTENITLPALENIVYFSAAAQGMGTDYNIGSNTMTYHDFTNYADSINQTLLVNNDASVVAALDDESDDNYRFRIQQQTLAGEAANYTAIRLNLLSVAGISDAVRMQYPRGIGTSDWLIKSVTPEVPQRLLDIAQQAIDDKAADGMENLAKAPVTIGVQLVFSITYRSLLEDSVKNLIKNNVRTQLISYINNLDIGESLVIDQLVKIVLNADDRILSMGVTSSSANFERINIYKRSALSNSKVRRTIIKDYVALANERVIVEPTIIDPVIISDNN